MGTAVKKRERLRQGFLAMQGYWARKAKGKGILTERNLSKYLNDYLHSPARPAKPESK